MTSVGIVATASVNEVGTFLPVFEKRVFRAINIGTLLGVFEKESE